MSELIHLVCPHCHTTNRLKPTSLEDAPVCGKCHQAMFTGQPIALNESAFDRHVSKNQIPVLVDFWAPWCGPCRMMAPAFEQAASLLEPHVRLAKVNTQDEQNLAARYQIRSTPTLSLSVSGQIVASQAGAFRSAQDIANWVKQALG